MGWVSIRERGKPVDCHVDWPLFYMNDFSKLGLQVAELGQALEVLADHGVRVLEDVRGNGLMIEDPSQLTEICTILAAAGIDSELTDLVSCVYQG